MENAVKATDDVIENKTEVIKEEEMNESNDDESVLFSFFDSSTDEFEIE